MAAVTKGSGAYFYDNDRVWREAHQTGLAPSYIGNWNGKAVLPPKPTPEIIRAMCDGAQYLGRVQANRVGCLDVTFTFGKSVSVALFGLTNPADWRASSEKLVLATRPEVAWFVENQRANAGPQGRDKVPSKGGAVGFAHWLSSRGDVHAHVHYAVPNLTATADGKLSSIANARDLFERQGVMRARSNKRLDDALQADGWRTVREGNLVGIAGIPAGMVRELSAARQAMDAARAQKGFTGARAHDHYARQARQVAGKGSTPTPDQAVARVRQVAARHGVTVDKLKLPAGTQAAGQDKFTAMSTAYDLAVQARDDCAKTFGTFTAPQFQERLYTLGIGQPTTLDALDAVGRVALSRREFLGISAHKQPDGTARYAAEKSAEAVKEAERPYRPDTAEAWADLKKATKGLGAAVLVRTAQVGAEALRRVAEAVNPPPRTLVVEAKDLPAFIAAHRPTHYLLAHAKALLAGAVSPGNPHDKAGAAERVYAALRQHDRVPKNTVLVVEGARYASARELHQLAKIARRDKACVVLSDRQGGPGRGGGGPGHGPQHQHWQSHNHGRP